MNTKILMTSGSLFLGIIGIALTFIPQEILEFLDIEADFLTILLAQILGSLYLGFAVLNWMAKGSPIGGIYNRPIAIGNFMHFTVGALTLVKAALNVPDNGEVIIPLAVIYALLALSFGYIFMNSPRTQKK